MKPPVRRGAPANLRSASHAAGAKAPESAASTSPPPMYSPADDPWNDMGGPSSIAIAEHVSVDAAVAASYSDGLTADEILAAEIARIRATRQPVGAFTQKLYYPPRAGYQRHWFNDSPGRILQAEMNGWAHVTDDRGLPVIRHAGTGRDSQGMQAHLMELPKVIWQEDMDLRHRQAREKVDALKAQPFRAPQGTADKSDAGKMYSPSYVDPVQIVKG